MRPFLRPSLARAKLHNRLLGYDLAGLTMILEGGTSGQTIRALGSQVDFTDLFIWVLLN